MDTVTTATTNLVLNSFLGRQDIGGLPAFSLPFSEIIKDLELTLTKS